jgi:hypothetical protein
MQDKKDFNRTKMDQRENPRKSKKKKKKIPPGAWMFVLCLLYKD